VSGGLPAALLALAGALATWPPARERIRQRVQAFHAVAAVRTLPRTSALAAVATSSTGDGAAKARRRRWALAGAAGLGAGLLTGGLAGPVVGAGMAVAAERLLRRMDGRADATLRGVRLRDLPVACDLLAVCLAGGLPVGSALGAVASAVPGPLGTELAQVAGLYRLGAEPRRAWAHVSAELAPLGRVVARAGESGSAIRSALRTLAGEARASARGSTEAAVRRAGVTVLAPLGLCFLPAFVCLGVAPLVLGIARDVFV
jgi:pilus assembly protein TadC